MKVKHLLIATILISLSVIDMYAAKYTVTITNDGGPGSLRDAVAAANATRDDDVIVFDISGCPNGVCTIVLTSGEIVVGDFWLFGRLTVLNPAGPQSLIISGNYASSVFYGFNSYLIINGLTVKHGPAGTWESAIECYGCGLVITRSEIVENAGIGVLATYSLLISNSTIANNNGRGVLLADASGWFENCTFTGNSGALKISESWAGFLNVTITDNSAQQGGGIFLESIYYGAGISLRNSIISENTATDGPDIYNAYGLGSIDNLGNNIISEPALLGTLANNGGPTRTHALLAGSPAINAGNDCVLTENGCGDGNPALAADQRGVGRHGSVDIGAYEKAYFELSGTVTTSSGRGVYHARIILSDSDGLVATAIANSFGKFSFTDVPGGMYTVSVRSKLHTFDPQVVELINDRTDLQLVENGK